MTAEVRFKMKRKKEPGRQLDLSSDVIINVESFDSLQQRERQGSRENPRDKKE